MKKDASTVGRIVKQDALRDQFPTHRHPKEFLESLGRAIATFGFLEEILGKAIFALSAATPNDAAEVDAANEEWSRTWERALTDPLGHLVVNYEKAFRNHPNANTEELEFLVRRLKDASRIRNVLCHGSWRVPDGKGASVPLFIDNKQNVFDTEVDCAFLDQVQRHVAELSCAVMNSVTLMGWQFPGSLGPRNPVKID